MTKHDDRPCTCRRDPVWNCPRHARTWQEVDSKLKGISKTSVAQQVRTAFLTGIKAERARLMYDNFGWVVCERCQVAKQGLNVGAVLSVWILLKDWEWW